jgi:hypothetical protein
LSLRTYWRGGDHYQNGNNQPQVHVMPPAMMVPNPKKVTKQKSNYACASGGTWPCGARFLRLLS